MTLKDIYNVFDNDFCECQEVLIRIHVYKDYDLMYTEREDSNNYLYKFADACDCIKFAELYNNKEYRENKFKQYSEEFDSTFMKTVFNASLIHKDYIEITKSLCDTTIVIDCDYVIYNCLL